MGIENPASGVHIATSLRHRAGNDDIA